MVTISNISGPSALGKDSATSTSPRGPRADAALPAETPGPDLTHPNGVPKALNSQQKKELPGEAFSQKDVESVVSQMQDALARATGEQYQVGFRQNEGSRDFVIEIKDQEGKLVKQFPPEKVLNLQRKMDELSGMVIDEVT